MTSIYTAIMKAADHIERSPLQYHFDTQESPENICGTRGCALGWIAFFAGQSRIDVGDFAEHVMKVVPAARNPEGTFYDRMDVMAGDGNWLNRADLAAKGLRRYAKKYHSPEPDWNALSQPSPARVTEDVR